MIDAINMKLSAHQSNQDNNDGTYPFKPINRYHVPGSNIPVMMRTAGDVYNRGPTLLLKLGYKFTDRQWDEVMGI